jgi:DNA repair protein RecO (recombination protein O)
MSTSRLYDTEAVVIRKSALGEADSILTLYSPNFGKIRAVAKGVRRPKSKIGGNAELLVHSQMLLVRSRSLDIISQSQAINSFQGLRSDLWRTSSAIYVAELVDRFTVEGQENYPLFRLLVETLERLVESRRVETVLRYFELHLLKHLGYQPELHECVTCHSPIEPGTNYFSPSGGGILCPRCLGQEVVLHPVSLNALKVLRFMQRSKYAEVDRLRIATDLSAELRQLMRRYLRYLLERDVKSADWLDSLERQGFGTA